MHAVLAGNLAWVADSDPGASAILTCRFPDVPNLGDITAIDWAAVDRVDVLTAGFPCQDVSCAGVRRGLRGGTRTGVWSYVAAAIGVLRPSLVLLENVRGILSAGADSNLEPCPWCVGETGAKHSLRASGAVLGDLASLGFDAEWTCVAASAVDAPHRRERIFILAWPAANSDRDTERSGPWKPDVDWWLQSRATRNLEGVVTGNTGEVRLFPTPSAGNFNDGEDLRSWETRRERNLARGINGNGIGTPLTIAVQQLLPTPVAADSRNARNVTAGRPPGSLAHSETTLCDAVQLLPTPRATDTGTAGRRASDGWRPPLSQVLLPLPRAVYGEPVNIAWGVYEAAVRGWQIITSRTAPRPTEPERTGERLSARFTEWMMGLPDGWVTGVPGLSRSRQLKALGNGVVPQQAALALRLLFDRTATDRRNDTFTDRERS